MVNLVQVLKESITYWKNNFLHNKYSTNSKLLNLYFKLQREILLHTIYSSASETTVLIRKIRNTVKIILLLLRDVLID